jgi:aminoglycoside phosphotransferase (APT) family kinase protein/8-oxo-dGTP pyrophosphatase MutT (NUDIX family)
MLEQVAALDIPMCLPIEFGTCADGVYSLQSWIDGEDLEAVLPLLSEAEQYVLGLKSGEMLKKMHSIPAPDTQEEWAARFTRKTNHKIKAYRECGIRFDGDDSIVEYIENNRRLLENRPQCFQHGDFHVGNMMLERGELKIIDFDRYDFGDPWEEFNRIVWCAAASPHFATGQLRGYFGGEPPMEFFKLLAFYIASNTLSSIYWAIPFGKSDLDAMMKQSQDVLQWYDNMRTPVPSWYLSGYEVWDVLDANGNKTGRFHERGKPMAAGDYHLGVHVWKHNGNGEWLIDKRTPKKGGKWETTGGAAIAGDDSLTTALRETNEELGFDLVPAKGTLFWQFANHVSDEHRCLIDVWVFEHDCAIEGIRFNKKETCDAIWATANEIRELIAKGEFFSICPYFDEMVERWRLSE